MGGIENEFSSLEPGEHVGLAHVSQEEKLRTIALYLRGGLRRGEGCCYVGSLETNEAIGCRLNESGLPVTRLRETGALMVREAREIYLREGKFDPTGLKTMILAGAKAARSAGLNGFRVVGDPGQVLDGLLSRETLRSHEAMTTDALRKSGSVLMCAFDRRKTVTAFLEIMLHTHPRAMLGGRLCSNPFCDPPSYSLGTVGEAKKIDSMINHILSEESGHRLLKSMNEALLVEATSLAVHNEEHRARVEALLRAQETRDKLLISASKWLSRPLPSLCAHLESMMAEPRNAGARDGLEQCHEYMEGLRRLSSELSEVARFLETQVVLQQEESDLVLIVRDAVTKLRGEDPKQAPAVKLTAPEKLLGEWDRLRLAQVMRSLVEAAFEHGWGTPIEVRVDEAGRKARVALQFRMPDHDPVRAGRLPATEPTARDGELEITNANREKLSLTVWTPREIVRLMGGSFGLALWADGRVVVTVELPRRSKSTTMPQFVQ